MCLIIIIMDGCEANMPEETRPHVTTSNTAHGAIEDFAGGENKRPYFFASYTLHGAIKDYAGDVGISASEAWALAGDLLGGLTSSKFCPQITEEMRELLQAAKEIPLDELPDPPEERDEMETSEAWLLAGKFLLFLYPDSIFTPDATPIISLLVKKAKQVSGDVLSI